MLGTGSEFAPEEADDFPAPEDDALLEDFVFGPVVAFAFWVEEAEFDDTVASVPAFDDEAVVSEACDDGVAGGGEFFDDGDTVVVVEVGFHGVSG